MNKIVSATEFKAKCLRLIDEMQKDGEPVTITRRGKVVATLTPSGEGEKPRLKPVLGAMKGTGGWAPGVDPTAPIDPDWEEKWLAKWDERLRDDPPR